LQRPPCCGSAKRDQKSQEKIFFSRFVKDQKEFAAEVHLHLYGFLFYNYPGEGEGAG
jgi:hypothetical protein